MNIYIAVVIGFLAIFLIVGVYVARKVKGANDFYVMGRNAPAYLIAGTLVATNASSVTLIGYTGSAYDIGPLPFVALYGMTSIASLWLGFHAGRYLWRMKLWTLPDFFTRRYPSKGVRLISTIIVIVSMILYLISVMLGTTVALNSLFGWNHITSLAVILVVITIFTTIGGMQGVVITDTLMFTVFFVASLLLAPYIIFAAGGWPAALESASAEMPNFLQWHGDNSEFVGIWFLLETNLMSFILVAASPQLVSRVYIAKSERTLARSMVLVACIMPVFVFGLIYVFGLVPLIAPDIAPVDAFPWVSLNLVPAIIGAIALAGIIAAAMSTASSLFQQGAAALSHDLYRGFIKPDAEGPRFMLISRLAVIVVAVIVFVGALIPQLEALAIVYAFLLASAAWSAWLPALIGGLLWRRATTTAALWSMTLGLVTALVVGFGRQFEYTPAWLPPNISGLLVATILMVVISLRGTPSQAEQQAFDGIDRSPMVARTEKGR